MMIDQPNFRDFVRTPLPEGEWYFEVPGYVVGTFEGPFPSYDVAVKAAKMCLQRCKGNGGTYSLAIHFIAKEEVTAGEQDMSDELKPCPFCGSDKIELDEVNGVVHCGGCDCEGPYAPRPTPENGVSGWNRRTPTDREKRLEDVLGRMTVLLREQYLLSRAQWRDRRKALVLEATALLAEQEKE